MRAWSAKATRRRADKQSRQLAEDTGGRPHKASGSLPFLKSDASNSGPIRAISNIEAARSRQYRAENKFTRAKSFSLTRADLMKIRGECNYDETPAFDISFLDVNGKTDERWVCIPYEEWVKHFKKE